MNDLAARCAELERVLQELREGIREMADTLEAEARELIHHIGESPRRSGYLQIAKELRELVEHSAR